LTKSGIIIYFESIFNNKQKKKMKRNELPQTLFIPSMHFPINGGAIDFQVVREKKAIMAFSSLEKAMTWLNNGGKEMWAEDQGDAFEHNLSLGGEIVIRGVDLSEYTNLYELIDPSSDVYIHFEPEIGQLFAPPDRQVALKIS
jgi:hypothetical protein